MINQKIEGAVAEVVGILYKYLDDDNKLLSIYALVDELNKLGLTSIKSRTEEWNRERKNEVV